MSLISVKINSVKVFNGFDSYLLLLKMQNAPKYRLIFVKKIGKFWEVVDFRENLTNGKV